MKTRSILQIFVGRISPAAALKLHLYLDISLVRTLLTQISSRKNMHSKCTIRAHSVKESIRHMYIYGTLWICQMEIRLQFWPDETKLNGWPQRQHSWNITVNEFIVQMAHVKWSKFANWQGKEIYVGIKREKGVTFQIKLMKCDRFKRTNPITCKISTFKFIVIIIFAIQSPYHVPVRNSSLS